MVMLFRRWYPITDLIGEPFWKAFWDCFRCKRTPTFHSHTYADDVLAALGHYHLWLGGVEHNDISVKNLMYNKLNGDSGVFKGCCNTLESAGFKGTL
jgi:hypothetical protein